MARALLVLLLCACGAGGLDEPPPGDGAAPLGAACTADRDCLEGLCGQGPALPGGFCTLSCAPGDDSSCGDPALACVTVDGAALCLARCADAADCDRLGYTCTTLDGRAVCAAGPAANPRVYY